jgi:hypothetical protein
MKRADLCWEHNISAATSYACKTPPVNRALLFVQPTTQLIVRNRAIIALIWSGTSIGEKCPDPSVRAITSCGVRLWNRGRSRRGIIENMYAIGIRQALAAVAAS